SRRAVVGVMSVSRDPNDDRGGWASPVSALRGGEGVPGELAGLGRTILELNHDAVLRDRGAWHRVLPVIGAEDLFDRPWLDLAFDPAAGPAAMLRAEFGVVPYMLRDDDLEQAAQWCED